MSDGHIMHHRIHTDLASRRPAAARMRCPVCGFTVARHVIERHIGDEYECPRCTDAVASEFVQDKHDD